MAPVNNVHHTRELQMMEGNVGQTSVVNSRSWWKMVHVLIVTSTPELKVKVSNVVLTLVMIDLDY